MFGTMCYPASQAQFLNFIQLWLTNITCIEKKVDGDDPEMVRILA